MKINTKVVFEWDKRKRKYVEVYSESHEHNGDIALCKGGSGSSTSTSSPPQWTQPYLEKIGAGVSSQLDVPMQWYGGQRTAGFTPEQTLAQQMTTQRATEGSPFMKQAGDEWSKTMRGDYLNPNTNPFLKQGFNQMLEETLPGIDTSARQAGMYGSSSQDLIRGKAMGDIGARIYEPERQRQTQAMNFAPTLANESYKDIGMLAGVGEDKQAMEQQSLNELVQKFEFGQMEPWQRYGMASNIYAGMPSGGTTTTSTQQRGK